jgi:hypothetical protein
MLSILFINAQIIDKLTITNQDFRFEKVNAYDRVNRKSDYKTNDDKRI